MQHFLIRAFRLRALFATIIGLTLCGQATSQTLSTLMFFDGVGPQGGLISDGTAVYGSTRSGGYAPGGLLYRLALDSSSIATIYEYGRLDVWTGANPGGSLIFGSDGLLYGVTQNTAIDTLRGGIGLGTGTIFRVNRAGQDYTKLFEFDPYTVDSRPYLVNATGFPPQGALIEGLEGSVRYLYGVAFQGGRDGVGVVYKIRADGSQFKVLHYFAEPYRVPCTAPCPAGTTVIDANADGRIKNPDGVNPNQRLLLHNNYLYGVTTNGGVNGTGVVFRIRTDADGNFVPTPGNPYDPVVKSFASFAPTPPTIAEATNANYGKLKTNITGGYPAGGLTVRPSDGLVYGTASGLGGYAPDPTPGNPPCPALPATTPPAPNPEYPPPNTCYSNDGGYGTLFHIDPNSPLTDASIVPAFAFNGATSTTMPLHPGVGPSGDLIIATDQSLVGTTQSGGFLPDSAVAAGTVYKIKLDDTHEQTCVFPAANAATLGATPVSGVIQTGDGGFFGTAYQGGYGNGVIFKCGTPHGAPPLGVPPPFDDGGGSLPPWMIAIFGALLMVQLARRRRLITPLRAPLSA